ncbi:tRNA (adenine-N1)-methyltransferase [Pseudomonas sp. B21-035]|uniref:tRNA (adenine-N1)-methyltransferase n=1 Tax=Pseudomonas sp. B21-035 TaxID=2895484 RepID=UPI000882A86E|nr:tRNA (adenine-N1)-methyltransferase [Pseudomonas sp. B21-035]UVL58597.1 tRNA (adenine-N1)-methyltransferase [Pseudomonas sp. B21-035]SDQ75094.1 tRNA (adenine-58-N(1)-) methyltransferase [Pseudomonas sp. UC 17F4]
MNSFCSPSAQAACQLPVGASQRRGPLRAGERVQLSDERGHLNVICLAPGGHFHTHKGYLAHDHIIGRPDGSRVTGSQGRQYLVFRPLLSNFIQSMPRGAAVVYPKDAGQIVTMADIFPGARVVEAGVGSGALSIALLRAVGDHGYLHSIERREEFADIARGNVQSLFGQAHPAWRVTLGDLQEQVLKHEAPGSIDRVVLDMLAPWECLEAIAEVLVPGGVWISYVATVTQLSRTAQAICADRRFTEPQAWESMVRGWHLEGLAVRPEHRMVAHTGFLLLTRRFADGAGPLVSVGQKKAFADEDLQAWNAIETTRRPTSGRKLRRAARAAAEGTGLMQDEQRSGD